MSNVFTVPKDTLVAQATASEPRISAWVSANAGSGKTHVLAQRVIRLLLEGADPSRILCLTYTRAAAANMATRVFKNLSDWTMLPHDRLAREIALLDGIEPSADRIKRARRLFARALETPGGLKIQTIHAFCEAVLHQFPLEANIAGHFELLDSQMETALVAEARREMIARAASDDEPGLAEAFAVVLQNGGESGLDNLLSSIVGKRDALRAFINQIGIGDGSFVPLFEEFGFSGSETKNDIASSIWPDSYFNSSLANQIAHYAAQAGKSTAAGFAENLGAACQIVDPADRLDALRNAFLTRKEGAWVARSTKNIMAKGVGEFFPDFAEEFARFADKIVEIADRTALFAMLEGTRAALVLADWLIARYERLKSARGFLDFNDLIVRTSMLLSRSDAGAWVQYKLDKGIDHILLDEAQDTSPEQWAVVKALASEFFVGEGAREGAFRTVFAVGDEKQSIYSFQGAEPESFALSGREFQAHVLAAEKRFEHVKLTRSFRSTEDVLTAVDLVFEREENRDGLTRDPEPVEHLAIRQNHPGQVEVWPSLGPVDVEEPEDWTQAIDHASAPAVRLANNIAKTIDGWLKSREPIPGKGREIRPGDVLVLVRKRDRFIHALGRELKNLSIPVAGADRLLLTGHIAVQDLLAVARFALQPDDDLSLAALLKSPVFGLNEDALFKLGANREKTTSLYAAICADESLASVRKMLDLWRREAGFKKPFDLYSGLLARDGLRRKFIARLGAEAGDVVDEFLNFCLASEKAGVTELEALVALLDGGGPEIKREMDQTRGEVRIMTAHAAKGLEAAVVFLVDSGAAAFSDSHLPRLMPFDAPQKGWRNKGFLWRASADVNNSFSSSLAKEAKRRAEQEYRRLLYVGMTRAEDRLIVCGYHGKTGQPDFGWHAMVRDALGASPATQQITQPVLDDTILRYSISTAKAVEANAAPQEATLDKEPAPASLFSALPKLPALPRPLSPSGAGAVIEREPDTETAKRSPVLDSQSEPSFALMRGVAAHKLLQTLPSLPENAQEHAALRYLRRIGHGWSADEKDRLWLSVRTILKNRDFASLFSDGSRAEVSIMGQVNVGGVLRAVSGRLDRLIVTHDAVLIVDYKTNRPPPRDESEIPHSHIVQMALYRALLSPIYPDKSVRAALVYTERPVLIQLDDSVMDVALARLAEA